MAKSKRDSNRPKYKPYPPYDQVRSGMKVSWYYYKNQADAEKAAEAARWNADIQASLGYDFGYQSPGYEVKQCNETYWPEYDGLYEVCIP